MRIRVVAILAALGIILSAKLPVRAQTEMTIAVGEVEVRSGPTNKFYATSKLRMGERVTIMRQDGTQRDWLAIKPPQGSFSWIKADYVEKTPFSQSAVVVKGTDPVPVKPGSSLSKDPPVDQAKVLPGTIFTIVGQPRTGPDGTWLMVLPPPTEVRYIPASAVRGGVSPVVAGPAPSTPASLTSLSKNPSTMPGNPNNALGAAAYAGAQGWVPANAPGGTTALYPTGPAQATPQCNPPQWSVYGQLRRSVFQKDGMPMYVLENKQGQPLLYVTAMPGFTLRDYVGKTMSMYGPISYHSDGALRRYYMTAIKVYVLY
jgi:uncharacterized protein YgiM (DUF1202 family)